jgi:hypothetical protein
MENWSDLCHIPFLAKRDSFPKHARNFSMIYSYNDYMEESVFSPSQLIKLLQVTGK